MEETWSETHEIPESSTKIIKITNTTDSPRKGTLSDIIGKLKFLKHLSNSTLNLFYKQRPDYDTSRLNSDFDSGCLTVAYFGLKF